MSTRQENFRKAHEKRLAANELLKAYIVENPQKIVNLLGHLSAFYFECSQSGLKSAMNTVNVTFASVALDVVKTAGLEDNDDCKVYLPVDATEMKCAIYYLSKLINLLDPISVLIENNSDLPAFRLAREAYTEGEDLG